MTTPPLSRQRTGREYVWPPTEPHELVVPSSTRILGIAIAKPWLAPWASRQTALYAVQHVESWRNLPTEDAIDLISEAPNRLRNRRASIGSIVHAAIAEFAGGRAVPDLRDEDVGYFHAALSFLDHVPLAVEHEEATVYSRTHGYAGTLDILGKIDDRYHIIDFKTGKAVYPQHALQLASYAYADFIGTDNGEEIPLPEIRNGIVVLLAQDGGYKAYPTLLTPDLFEVFLACRRLWYWTEFGSRQAFVRKWPPTKKSS